VLYCSILLHCIDLVFGILSPSMCSFGWCSFFFSLISIYKLTTCFDLISHLQCTNSFYTVDLKNKTATATISFLTGLELYSHACVRILLFVVVEFSLVLVRSSHRRIRVAEPAHSACCSWLCNHLCWRAS
jgi:hypothetical protein